MIRIKKIQFCKRVLDRVRERVRVRVRVRVRARGRITVRVREGVGRTKRVGRNAQTMG